MKLDVKMLNLLGLLAMVVVLGLGALSIVMPLFDRVQATQSLLDQERNTNENLRFKLTALTSAEQRQAEIEDHLASLRVQLPNGPHTDGLVSIIADALDASGAFIQQHELAEATLFAPRGAEAPLPGETPEATADSPESQVAGLDEEHLEGLPEDLIAELEGSGQAEALPEQQQVEVTIKLAVTGDAQATEFLDALGAGNRAFLVTSSAMTESEFEGFGYELTVTLMMFFYDVAVSDE